jgi:hypothetical protein
MAVIPFTEKSAILTDVGSTKDYIVSQVNKEIKSKCGGENQIL